MSSNSEDVAVPSTSRKNVQIESTYSPEVPAMGVKIYNIGLLIADIFILFLKMFYHHIEALYRLVVPKPEKPVNQEIVLITGTGHGIGRELALQYGALGATIVCWDINEQNNQETVKEVIAQGGKAHGFVCDVAKRENVLEVAQKVKQQVGDVTILVNNAGIMPAHPFVEHTPEEIKRIFDINVLAHFWIIEAFLPTMIERNQGHIVALASMAGMAGFCNLVPYCGSKFAVRGYMEALHEELRTDPRNLQIKFTTVCPYMVDTGLCKVINIRFPGLLPVVKPKDCAASIISAQRRDIPEVTVPGSLAYINGFVRTLPVKVSLLIKDFLDSGVGSDSGYQ